MHRLAAILQVPPGDLEDEHRRWELFQLALERDVPLRDIRACVAAEPNEQIVVGVLFALLERDLVDDVDPLSARAVPLSQASVRLVQDRARELEDLRATRKVDAAVDPEAVARWSDWLQRRAAIESGSAQVLDVLARAGRTRRVRNLAAATLRARD